MKQVVVMSMVLGVLVLMGSAARDVSERAGMDERLSGLDPAQPNRYVERGVRMLAIKDDAASAMLAKELLVRGAVYAARGGDGVLASSACMALLDIVDPSERDQIRDLALVLDPSRLAAWASDRADAAGRDLDRQALACVSSIRYHDASTARELWGLREVRARIRDAASLAGLDADAAVAAIEQELERAIDDPCKGRLYVVDREDRGQRRVCPNHLRGVGLSANDDRLLIMLAIEARLSGARGGGWSEDRAGADPVLPTIEDLIRVTRVDVSRPFYRDGAWAR